MPFLSKYRSIRTAVRLVATLLACSFLSIGQEVLSNDSVVKMVKARLGEDLIVEMIRNQPGKYTLTTDSLIQLKQQGVPDKVLAAMIAKGSGTGPGAPESDKGSHSDQRPPGTWEFHEATDPMTGQASIEASMVTKADRDGSVEVSARCGVAPEVTQLADSLDPHFLTFYFAYSSDKGIVLHRSPVDQTISRAPTIFGTRLGDDTISAPTSCAWLRVKIGDAGAVSVMSNDCRTDHVAALGFVQFRARDLTKALMGPAASNQGMGALAGLVGAVCRCKDSSIATMTQILNAGSLLVELPLSNGVGRVVDVRVQDPGFRQFASKCLAFPVPESMRQTHVTAPSISPATRPAPPQVATRPELQFTGSPEDFARAFPGFLQRSSSALALDSRRYEKESAALIEIVRTCARITPEMAQRSIDPYRRERLRTLGEEFKVCEASWGYSSVSDKVKASDRLTERGIVYQIRAANHWRDGFLIRVLFTALKSDPALPQANSLDDAIRAGFNAQGIVLAKIQGSGSTPAVPPAAAADGSTRSRIRVAETAPDRPRPGVKTEEELLAALDNSIWIPDGPVSDKQLYIIAGPCCGYSQALYRISRNLTNHVQFRWVEMAPTDKSKCLEYLGESAMPRNTGLLAKMYETLAEPAALPTALRDNAIRWNAGVESAIAAILRELDPAHGKAISYPTLVWLAKDGVHVSVRPDQPNSVSAILESVVSRPEAAAITPAARILVTASYQIQPIPPKFYLAKEPEVGIYALPDVKAQLIYTLPKDRGYRGIRRVIWHGESWIEIAASNDTWRPGNFVRESQVYPQR